MAIRELIRRGYWEENDGDGNDLGAGPAADGGGEGGSPADGSQDAEAGTGDDGGEGGEGEGRSLAEEIAQSLGMGKAEGEAADGDSNGSADKVDGKEGADAKVPDGKAAAEADPYEEPEGLKRASRQTQDRFHELVRWNKEKDTQIQELTQSARGFVEMVRDTGANQEQFLEVLDVATLMFHPERANPAEAVNRLYNAAKSIAAAAGLPLPGYDPLEAFPDLKQRVDNDDIDRETAEELARVRQREQVQQKANEQRKQVQQQQGQARQVLEKAVSELTTFLADKEKNDVDFPAKAKLLLEQAAFARENLHPSRWLAYMQKQYEFVGKHVKKAATTGDGHQPLRSGGGSKGSKTPSSHAEAIKQSIFG